MAGKPQIPAIIEDMSLPIQYIDGYDEASIAMREGCDAFNRYALEERESHGRRTRLRLEFLVWMRSPKRMENVRLKRKHLTLICPNSEQAELAMETIRQLCKAMSGRHLAKTK